MLVAEKKGSAEAAKRLETVLNGWDLCVQSRIESIANDNHPSSLHKQFLQLELTNRQLALIQNVGAYIQFAQLSKKVGAHELADMDSVFSFESAETQQLREKYKPLGEKYDDQVDDFVFDYLQQRSDHLGTLNLVSLACDDALGMLDAVDSPDQRVSLSNITYNLHLSDVKNSKHSGYELNPAETRLYNALKALRRNAVREDATWLDQEDGQYFPYSISNALHYVRNRALLMYMSAINSDKSEATNPNRLELAIQKHFDQSVLSRDPARQKTMTGVELESHVNNCAQLATLHRNNLLNYFIWEHFYPSQLNTLFQYPDVYDIFNMIKSM